MKLLRNLATRLPTGLSALLACDLAMAGLPSAQMPGPGVLGLVALGVIGAITVARSRE
ncbi:MAG: hypothetical protein WBM97_20910 [Sedimenticolaceae bacterium]